MHQLRHDEAVQYLIDYQFGRLPRQLNSAVEAHIRDCTICQRQGLGHAATERREIARQFRKVRPSKQRLSGRGRGAILVLIVIAVLQVGVFELSRGANSPLGSLFGSHPSAAATATATATPPPSVLTSGLTYAAASVGTVALSLSPDEKTLATTSRKGAAGPVVTLWSATTGKPVATLAWPGQSVPGVLAWSPDGKSLAAADGSLVGIWTLPTATPVWTLNLPGAPAIRVYDAQAATIVQEPDPATTFASGASLRWSTAGSLVSVPSTSGSPPPISAPGGQQIDLWRTDGSHIFADGKNGALVGISSADASRHAALLSWSPDGHYLFWASVSRPVATPSQTSASTPAPSATVGAAPDGVPVPNSVVGQIAHEVATSGHGDALIWFSPDAHFLLSCDRSTSGAALIEYDLASGRIVSQLPGACDGLSAASLAWQSTPSALIVAMTGQPITVYPLPGAAG